MSRNRVNRSISSLMEEDRKRRKREGVLIIVIIVAVSLLTFAETRIIHFSADFPISNTILMFILININILLLILLIFLVFRNLVKLFYARKRKVMGAKLRTKLVVTFIPLSLLPTTVLFYFSIKIIFILLFIFLANPTATHAIIDAGYGSEVRPWAKKPTREEEENDLAV